MDDFLDPDENIRKEKEEFARILKSRRKQQLTENPLTKATPLNEQEVLAQRMRQERWMSQVRKWMKEDGIVHPDNPKELNTQLALAYSKGIQRILRAYGLHVRLP